MAVQTTLQVDLRYIKEATFGTMPSGNQSWQRQRFIGSTLSLSKDTFGSEERRTDRNISDLRHGVRRVGGDISGEFSLKGWDDWLEAALGGSWVDELSHSQTTMTSCAATAASGTTLGKFTIAPTDAATNGWVGAGYRVGDIIRFTGLTAGGNNNKNFRIVSLTNTVAEVLPSPTTMSADTSFSLKRTGKRLIIGNTARSFSIEQAFGDITQFQRFTGCRVNTVALSLPPSGVVGITVGIVGQNQQAIAGSALSGQTLVDRPTESVMAALNGSMMVDKAQVALVTGMDLNIANNVSGEPVVGSNTVPDLFVGRCAVTGTMTVFMEDATFINYFVNETVTKVGVLIEDPTDSSKFINFYLPAVKFGGADVGVSGEGGVTLSMPFQAILGTGTGVDASSLKIQRSNN